jgi:sporulation and spore germination protein
VNERIVLITQRVLFALIAIVLFLVAITAFRKIVENNDPILVAPPTTLGTIPAPTTTTTTMTPTTVTTSTVLSSTTVVVAGSCTMPSPAENGGRLVRVYFTCGSQPFPTANTSVVRRVEPTNRSLTATLTELVKGPTDVEQSSGFRSFFNAETADAFDAVFLNDGRATVEFSRAFLDRTLNESEAAFFVATMNANVFQFASVESAEYRINGNCNAFWEPVGSRCVVVTRADWEAQVRDWRNANG